MKGLNGFRRATHRDPHDSEKQLPSISLNLSGISNFNLVSPPCSLSTTAASSAESFLHPALEWSEAQVVQWLCEKNLGSFESIFLQHDINGQVLLELDHTLLKMMSIHPLVYRIRILEAIKDLKREYYTKMRCHMSQKNELHLTPEMAHNSPQSYKTSPGRPMGAFLKRNKHNADNNQPEVRLFPDPKKSLNSELVPTPPISPEPAGLEAFSIMSFGMVKKNCVRVFGSDGQTRVVSVADARDAHTILSKVLAKFNISDEPSKYAIFVVSGDSTRSLQDDELVEICNSVNRPERDKFILRKKHLPVNHFEFKKYHAQRLAASQGSPRPEPQTPSTIAHRPDPLGPGANQKHDKLTKIFGTRPPSELISSNLQRFFSVPEEIPEEAEICDSPGLDSPQSTPLSAICSAQPRTRSVARVELSSSPPSPHELPSSIQPLSPLYGDSEVTLVEETSGNRGQIQWQQGAFIGAGSYGEVYMGLNQQTAELMAIKRVPLPRFLPYDQNNPRGTKQNEKMLEALHREVNLLRTLDHPNIVRYIDSQVDQSDLVILLEYVPGGSIAGLLSAYGPFEEAPVRSFVGQILQGLAFLHERGIIHRDIKGGNILIDNKGRAKISDFGISKKMEENSVLGTNHRASFQGSIYWMAPEVVKQTYYTPKADIWALGCLVIEMITGIHPFPNFNQTQAIFQIGSFNSPTIPEKISSACQSFLEKTFRIKHHERPSAEELLAHDFVVKKTCT